MGERKIQSRFPTLPLRGRALRARPLRGDNEIMLSVRPRVLDHAVRPHPYINPGIPRGPQESHLEKPSDYRLIKLNYAV